MKSRIPRPIFCDKTKICDHFAATITKKKLILRALRQKSDDGKCDQKKKPMAIPQKSGYT